MAQGGSGIQVRRRETRYPVYLYLMQVMGLPDQIRQHLQTKQRGWTDVQMVLSLMLLNLAGGNCEEDMSKVGKDDGFCRIFRQAKQQGMRRAARREEDRRWRKERWRSVPSASASFALLRSREGSAVWADRVCDRCGCNARVQEGGTDGIEPERLEAEIQGL